MATTSRARLRMDNVTHTLTGIALSQAGLKRKTRFALLALIIGSNLPDIDVLASAGRGGVAYLKYHRGITHSLIGLTALAILLALAIWGAGRRAKQKSIPMNLKWLFLICWIATACHVLMDYTNSYGIRPFLPFSGRWHALDITPLIDPYMLLFLILGLGIPAVLGIAAKEMGAAKRSSTAGRTGAIIALCGVVATGALRGASHHRVMRMLGSYTFQQEAPTRLGAFPSALDPFHWTAITETREADYVFPADSLAANLDLESGARFLRPESSAALTAARRSPAGKVFLNFARFPWATTVDAGENGYVVYIRDLRFASPGSERWGFVLEVRLSPDVRVLGSSFRFSMARPFG
ncbi:MAG: metal-dependent hydrolase [Terriglobia bacterium]